MLVSCHDHLRNSNLDEMFAVQIEDEERQEGHDEDKDEDNVGDDVEKRRRERGELDGSVSDNTHHHHQKHLDPGNTHHNCIEASYPTDVHLQTWHPVRNEVQLHLVLGLEEFGDQHQGEVDQLDVIQNRDQTEEEGGGTGTLTETEEGCQRTQQDPDKEVDDEEDTKEVVESCVSRGTWSKCLHPHIAFQHGNVSKYCHL